MCSNAPGMEKQGRGESGIALLVQKGEDDDVDEFGMDCA
jgi:hypothetical protein